MNPLFKSWLNIWSSMFYEGGEWEYENPPIHAFFPQICRSIKIFVQIRNHNHIQKTEVLRFKGELVHENATVNFAQM